METAPTSPEPEPQAQVQLELRIGDGVLKAELGLPAGPTRPTRLLPVLHALANTIVERATEAAREAGESVSCRAGCGACCRQMVPVAAAEARALAELVAALPEPGRSEVIRRFAAARERLAEAGLLERLRRAELLADDEVRELGLVYFRLGIPCPFLEQESCSIHPARPLICREYVVISPAEDCAALGERKVRRLGLAGDVSRAAVALEHGTGSSPPRIALVLALEWAAEHPEPAPGSTGPELLRAALDRLARHHD